MQHTGAQFVEQASQTPPKSVEEFLRFHSKGILDKIGGFFLKLGCTQYRDNSGACGEFYRSRMPGIWSFTIVELWFCCAVLWMHWMEQLPACAEIQARLVPL
jgi:hypothetical protein